MVWYALFKGTPVCTSSKNSLFRSSRILVLRSPEVPGNDFILVNQCYSLFVSYFNLTRFYFTKEGVFISGETRQSQFELAAVVVQTPLKPGFWYSDPTDLFFQEDLKRLFFIDIPFEHNDPPVCQTRSRSIHSRHWALCLGVSYELLL